MEGYQVVSSRNAKVVASAQYWRAGDNVAAREGSTRSSDPSVAASSRSTVPVPVKPATSDNHIKPLTSAMNPLECQSSGVVQLNRAKKSRDRRNARSAAGSNENKKNIVNGCSKQTKRRGPSISLEVHPMTLDTTQCLNVKQTMKIPGGENGKVGNLSCKMIAASSFRQILVGADVRADGDRMRREERPGKRARSGCVGSLLGEGREWYRSSTMEGVSVENGVRR